MKMDETWNGPGRVTAQFDFGVFADGTMPLLSVREGVPVSEALSVVQTIFECVADFEDEAAKQQERNRVNDWASYWLLSIAEAIMMSVRKNYERKPNVV